jgi:opacity protein-like surface antigen
MKTILNGFGGIALVLVMLAVSPLAAQTAPTVGSAYSTGGDYPYKPKNTDQSPAFQTNAVPRTEESYGTDKYVAVWGGANLFQQADPSVKDNFGLGIKQDLSLKDSTNFAVGAKIGYIWNLNDLRFYGEKSSLTLLPSIEGEFIYTNNNGSKLQLAGSISDGVNTASGKLEQHYDLDIYALTVNPIMRVQWGIFRPYIGFGIGGAYVDAKNKGITAEGTVNGSPVSGELWSSGGSESQVAFCFQGIAGTDVFLSKQWSLFLEYKYLGLVGLEFEKAIGGYATYDMGDIYGNHLVVAGLKFHY